MSEMSAAPTGSLTLCGLTSTQESTAPMGALCSVSSLGALVVILKLIMPVCMQ